MNRELKYVILGDDRLSKKLKGITGASTKTNNALNRTSKRIGAAQAKFKGMASELPIVGRGLSMLTSPAGIAAGAVLAVGAGLNKAIDSAEEFNSTFRELNNMNLDKTRAEIKALKSSILDLSFDQGFDANKTSTGFYDVQSITGKYGAEVESIVAKQGKFAQVMKANFNEWIAGSAKAMANYNFGADELDRYNASAAATIQVGVTTYDQYAKVSSVFAGSAAAAKQSYDSSNKLFALFTKKTKTVDEAATLVKSAFNDLFKSSSIKAFKSIGIDLFDVNGKAKQVDKIMKELNVRFSKADSDRAMTKLRNQFKGSEGLISLIQTASDQSGDMLRSFEAFDNNKFSFGGALEKYNEDLASINSEINNKIKTAWTELGLAILPAWIKIKKIVLGVIDGTKGLIQDTKAMLGIGKSSAVARTEKQSSDIKSGYDEYAHPEKYTNKQLQEFRVQMNNQAKAMSLEMNSERYKENFLNPFSSELNKRRKEYSQKVLLKQTYEEMEYTIAGVMKKRGKNYAPNTNTTPVPDGGGSPAPDSSTPTGETKKGLEAISGGGSRVRNINVDIGKLVETLSIQAATVKEGAAEMREIIQEELMRAVSGFEQSISQ